MKTLLAAVALASALILSGCSGNSINKFTEGEPQTPVSPAESLGTSWASAGATAQLMAEDLVENGFCKIIFDEASGTYGGDFLEAYRSGTGRACSNYEPSEGFEGMECPATFYIASGSFANSDPKRSLSYEDGSSVALFFGDNYRVEYQHAETGMEDGAILADRCSSLTASIAALVGGQVNRHGDYESELPSATPTPSQTVDKVEMPNLVGAIDGRVRSWLVSNGYKFSVNIQSTGFNPKTSCLVAGNNAVLSQQPAAGTLVSNTSTTMVWLKINCEW